MVDKIERLIKTQAKALTRSKTKSFVQFVDENAAFVWGL